MVLGAFWAPWRMHLYRASFFPKKKKKQMQNENVVLDIWSGVGILKSSPFCSIWKEEEKSNRTGHEESFYYTEIYHHRDIFFVQFHIVEVGEKNVGFIRLGPFLIATRFYLPNFILFF